jgi:hypothetical protein
LVLQRLPRNRFEFTHQHVLFFVGEFHRSPLSVAWRRMTEAVQINLVGVQVFALRCRVDALLAEYRNCHFC